MFAKSPRIGEDPYHDEVSHWWRSEDDMCQCPHWGYVLKDSLHMRYTDGTEEVIKAGEMRHATPGHTVWCEEDTEFIDVSPADEFAHVIDHVRKLMTS